MGVTGYEVGFYRSVDAMVREQRAIGDDTRRIADSLEQLAGSMAELVTLVSDMTLVNTLESIDTHLVERLDRESVGS